MVKSSKDVVSARQLMVLERAFRDKDGASISGLAKECKVSPNTIVRDAEDLHRKIPIIEVKGKRVHAAPTGLEAIWSGRDIGERLGNYPAKENLAKKVFSFIKEHRKAIQRLVLGSGTTVRECARELMKGAACLGDMRIHTANLLVLHDFVYHKPSNLCIELPRGEVDLERATLWSEDIVEYFQGIEPQAVITSFSDVHFEEGFCTRYDDAREKLANLRPKFDGCRWVIIPMEWSKIARCVHDPVTDSRDEQLDFVGGKRKYIIITDRPSPDKWDKNVDDEKLADLDLWKETYKDGIEIIYA